MATSFAQRSPLWQCPPSVHNDRLIGRARRTRCDALYLGIDFGTSGSRAIVIDGEPLPAFNLLAHVSLYSLDRLGESWQHNPISFIPFIPFIPLES